MIAEKGNMVLLKIFQHYNNEAKIGKSILNLITLIACEARSFIYIYDAFMPFILECFRLFQDHLMSLMHTKAQEINKPSDISVLTVFLSLFRKKKRKNKF